MTLEQKRERGKGGFVTLPFYGSTVKLPLVRIPFSVPPLAWVLPSAGVVPQSITIWKVNDLPMSALVNVFVNCSPRRFEPPVPFGVSVKTGVVSVNDIPSPSTALIWTSAKIVVLGSVFRTPNFQVCWKLFLDSDSLCFQVAWLNCGADAVMQLLTVTLMVTERVRVTLLVRVVVPVTTTVKLPVAAVGVSVRVEVPDIVMLVGLNAAPNPVDGETVSLSKTVPANPPSGPIVMMSVTAGQGLF